MKTKELGQSFEPIKIEIGAESKARVEHVFIKDLMELKEVTLTPPEFIPKKFYDQIQFYYDGTNYWLYLYIDNLWKKIQLT